MPRSPFSTAAFGLLLAAGCAPASSDPGAAHGPGDGSAASTVEEVPGAGGRGHDLGAGEVQAHGGEDLGTPLAASADPRYRAVGVIAYPVLGDFCTATYVDVGGADGAPAYALTNAHCLLPEVAWELLTGEEVSDVIEGRALTSTVSFGNFVDAPAETRVRVRAVRAELASLRGTDLAILRLDATVGALRARGVVPLPLASTPPAPGTEVELVGVNLEKVPTALQVLHRTTCTTGGTFHVRAADVSMPRSVLHGCSEVAGTSGGPLLARGAFVVTLLNNAAVRDDSPDEPACSAARPCEVDADGAVSVRAHARYGQRVSSVGACFAAGLFDRALPGCALGD